jgi:hypothetical protein
VEKITQAREQSEKIKKNHPALQVGVPAREIFFKKNTQQQVIHHSKGSSHIDV